MRIKLSILLILLVLGIAGAIGFVYVGAYNVAATEQHTRPVYALLEYAMRKSVQLRSGSIQAPDLKNQQRVLNGLGHYREHCLQCHGAPGEPPEPFGLGMMPAPANMVAAAREWTPAELYWIIRYGIKMSGMPAWEYRLDEQELWDVVAFVAHLPQLSVAEYREMVKQAPVPQGRVAQPAAAVLGDAKAGKRALQQYLCVTCHQIPSVPGANRHVGPPLNGMASRKYIGGIIPNTPENMVRWLENPQQFDSASAMPNLGVTDKDARDMAAFLYTLDDVD